MFRPIRARCGRLAPPLQPPDTRAEQTPFDRAWADYVEWSGLDEAGLPDALRGDDPR
ncbi:hypothetical protein GCM10009570_10300 [Dietzia natronolimnaea]